MTLETSPRLGRLLVRRWVLLAGLSRCVDRAGPSGRRIVQQLDDIAERLAFYSRAGIDVEAAAEAVRAVLASQAVERALAESARCKARKGRGRWKGVEWTPSTRARDATTPERGNASGHTE
jgi:hypothetical protein